MKRGKGRTKLVFLLLFSIIVVMIVGGLAYLQFRPMVVEAVTMEAGAQMIDVEEFLLVKNRKGSFITDIQELNLKTPGTYEVKIKVGNRVDTSKLTVIDTIAPTATVVDQMVLKDDLIEAEAFVTEISDATEVAVSLKEAPDLTLLGDQEVTIVLEDSSHNCTELKAVLTILDMKKTVTIEAGSLMDVTVDDFLDNDNYVVAFESNLAELAISKPITHDILVNVDGKSIPCKIEVIDTIAPIAEIRNKEIWNDETPSAMFFVNYIKDASGVTVTYKETPDFTRLGDQEVTIVLEDDCGNRMEQSTILTIKADTQPPSITGIADKTVYIGDSISYKKGVMVTDNKDEDIVFEVNSSNVNLKKEGTYDVIYSAKDTAGNITSKNIKITVIKFVISEDLVNEMSDDILAKIVTNHMTKREKAYEIYLWVKKHVGYTGNSDKTDWLAEAYRGMKNGVGDCFTYYTVAQALLTRAGIDNMGVTRVGGRTLHFWNLVNCGDGWYHYDTCPNKDHMEAFMLTDKQVEDYTKKRGNHYYTFDKSLYPATPEK